MLNKISIDSIASITSTSSIFSPISVIKELLENSIDANSTQITIELDHKTCGLQFIQLKDNGDGIPIEDRPMMFLNHTTSKISTVDDLNGVKTLGFRGEALYFINELTYPQGWVEVSSRIQTDKMGQVWRIGKDGEAMKNKPIAMPKGTIININTIFKKLPVRYKILSKQKSLNLDKVKQLVLCYSLIHPDIRFHLKYLNFSKNNVSTIQSQEIFHSLNQMNYLTKAFKSPFFSNVAVVNNWKISVILPKMNASSTTINIKKQLKLVSINKRLITIGITKKITKCLNKIYEDLKLFTPNVFLIQLENFKTQLDFNIEPEKNDVLIKDEYEVLEMLEGVLEQWVAEGHGLFEREEVTDDEKAGIKEVKEILEDLFDGEEIQDINNLEKKSANVEVSELDNSEDELHNTEPISDIEDSQTSLDITKPISITNDRIDRIDWSHNMHDHLSSRSNTAESLHNDLSDESFQISKDISISNPFTLTNLQRKNTITTPTILTTTSCNRVNNQLLTPDNSIDEVIKPMTKNQLKLPNPPRVKPSTSHSSSIQTSKPTSSSNSLKPVRKIEVSSKRYELSTFQYLQSFHLKIIPKVKTPNYIPLEEFEPNEKDDISTNIKNYIKELENDDFMIVRQDGWFKAQPNEIQ